MVEQKVKRRALSGTERLNSAPLYFCLQTTATNSAFDSPIGIEQSLGAEFLWARTLHAVDDRQCYWFPNPSRLGKCLENCVFHKPARKRSPRTLWRNEISMAADPVKHAGQKRR